MKAETILSGAADLVARPGGWTQGAYARSRGGRSVSVMVPLPDEVKPSCFCTAGAIRHVGRAHAHALSSALDAAEAVLRERGDVGTVIRWNDATGRTQGEAVELLLEASRRAREDAR